MNERIINLIDSISLLLGHTRIVTFFDHYDTFHVVIHNYSNGTNKTYIIARNILNDKDIEILAMQIATDYIQS